MGSSFNPNDDVDNIEFDFTLVTGGRLNEGICFNVTINPDNSFNGYFLSLCNHANDEPWLYKFTNYKIDSSFSEGINAILWCNPSQIDCLNKAGYGHTAIVGRNYTYQGSSFVPLAKHASVGNSNVKYHISYKNNNIIVTANGKEIMNLYDDSYTHGTYGFWGNNCEMNAYMYIKDFNVKTIKTITKEYTDILRSPEWREDADHYIVDVNNSINNSFTNTSSIGEVLTRTINDNIDFIQWGSNANKEVMTNFIAQNNNNGTFIDGSNYDLALTKTIDYIVSKYNLDEKPPAYL